MDAEEEKVLQSIHRTNGHHFMTGFTIHARASTSRTHNPEFSTEDFDDTTNKLICELHLEAAAVCEKMSNIHTYITCLQTWVSPKDFLTIISLVGLSLTTITTLVRYWMQNYLLKTQWQYSMVACEGDFNLGRTKFERVVSGKK